MAAVAVVVMTGEVEATFKEQFGRNRMLALIQSPQTDRRTDKSVSGVMLPMLQYSTIMIRTDRSRFSRVMTGLLLYFSFPSHLICLQKYCFEEFFSFD